MCCSSNYHYRYAGLDKHLGHHLVSQMIANYISRSPAFYCQHSRSPTSSPEREEPLDLYIARVIHASGVPDTVAYAALHFLATISQTGRFEVPHEVWTERLFFVGAFYLAVLAYKAIVGEESRGETSRWNMFHVCGISEKEIRDVSMAFKDSVDYDLQMVITTMMRDNIVISVSEFECPRVAARRRRLLQTEDGSGDEKGQKRRMGLKRCISSFLKPRERATSIESEEPPRSVYHGPSTGSEHPYFYF